MVATPPYLLPLSHPLLRPLLTFPFPIHSPYPRHETWGPITSPATDIWWSSLETIPQLVLISIDGHPLPTSFPSPTPSFLPYPLYPSPSTPPYPRHETWGPISSPAADIWWSSLETIPHLVLISIGGHQKSW